MQPVNRRLSIDHWAPAGIFQRFRKFPTIQSTSSDRIRPVLRERRESEIERKPVPIGEIERPIDRYLDQVN